MRRAREDRPALPLILRQRQNLGPGLPVKSGPHRWQLTVDGQQLDEAVLLFLEPQQDGATA